MYKLLIADDEFEIRNGLFKYFPWNEVGFEVVGQAENGMQVIEYVKDNPVDIILCDIKMPIMNGLELAEYFRKKYPEILICFLTAYADFNFAQKAVSLNAVQYLLKSSSSADLMEIFRAIKASMDESRRSQSERKEQKSFANTHSHGDDPESEDFIIKEIRQYVYTQYATANLAEVARTVYMTPNYVSKLFKKKTKQNFSDFLLSVKMEKAAELLLDFRYKIYEVSFMVGYKHVKNFTRAFKDFYEVTPREYRNGKPLRHNDQQ